MQLTGNNQIRHLVLAQFGAAILIAVALLLVDTLYAWSALIGGLISATINGLVARKVFVPYRAQNPGEVLAQLYGAEFRKLVLTVASFAVVLTFVKPISVGALLASYLTIQVMVPIMVFFLEDRLKTR